MVRMVSKAFVSPNPARTMVRVIVTGVLAFLVSNFAIRTFLAVFSMAAADEALAFGAAWTDPLQYGPVQFFVSSALGGLGGAVSYVRDQNAKAWETASVRTFTGHMIVAQFAAVIAFLLAVYAGFDNLLVLASTGLAGYLGDRFLDRADPLFDKLFSVFSAGRNVP